MADGNGNKQHVKARECTCEPITRSPYDPCIVHKKDGRKEHTLVLKGLSEVEEGEPTISYPSKTTCGQMCIEWDGNTVFHEPLPGAIMEGKCKHETKTRGGNVRVEVTLKKEVKGQDWDAGWAQMR